MNTCLMTSEQWNRYHSPEVHFTFEFSSLQWERNLSEVFWLPKTTIISEVYKIYILQLKTFEFHISSHDFFTNFYTGEL